jgi:competence protein ComEC
MRHHCDAAASLATRLPGPCSLAGASALALALIRLHGRAVAGVAMTLLLVVWGVLSAHQALWPTRHLTGAIRQAEVILARRMARPAPWTIVRLAGPLSVSRWRNAVRGTCTCASLCGSSWLMTLRLRPVHGQLNDGALTASAMRWRSIDR